MCGIPLPYSGRSWFGFQPWDEVFYAVFLVQRIQKEEEEEEADQQIGLMFKEEGGKVA